MGMYDCVIREPVKCPSCGRELNNFQSKSGFCDLLKVTPEQLIEDSKRLCGNDIVEYYDYCPERNCEGAVLFFYDPEKPEDGWKVEHRKTRKDGFYSAGEEKRKETTMLNLERVIKEAIHYIEMDTDTFAVSAGDIEIRRKGGKE